MWTLVRVIIVYKMIFLLDANSGDRGEESAQNQA